MRRVGPSRLARSPAAPSLSTTKGESTMAIWDDVLNDRDREVYAQFRGAKELGKRPALVVVDVNYAFTGLQSEPILESIKTFRTSCGEVAWEVVPRLQKLIAVARE